MDKFWAKLTSKFMKIGDMFRFFDRNFDNAVSFNEFRVVVEELDLRLSTKEIKDLFDFIDKNKEGTITYDEFIIIHEDRRLNFDPFANKIAMENFDNDRLLKPMTKDQMKEKADIMKVFQDRKKLFDVFKSKSKNYHQIED